MTDLCVFCHRTIRPVYKDEMCRQHYDHWLKHGTPIPTDIQTNSFKGNGHIICEICTQPVRDHPVGPACQKETV